MSSRITRHHRRRLIRASLTSPKLCAEVLGQHIQAIRLRDGRPLEEIALRAALTVPEWEAIEAGQVPDTWEQICLIASALDLGQSWAPYLHRLYAGAWAK